jgi:hypothetical protein
MRLKCREVICTNGQTEIFDSIVKPKMNVYQIPLSSATLDNFVYNSGTNL